MHVAQFLENSIICRFRVAQGIISDNGSHFEGEIQRVTEDIALSITSLHHINYKPMGP